MYHLSALLYVLYAIGTRLSNICSKKIKIPIDFEQMFVYNQTIEPLQEEFPDMKSQTVVVIWSWKRLFASFAVFAVLLAVLTGFCVGSAMERRAQHETMRSTVSLSYSAVKG